MLPRTQFCKWSLGLLPAAGGMGPKWPAMPTEPLRIELNMIMQVGGQADEDDMMGVGSI